MEAQNQFSTPDFCKRLLFWGLDDPYMRVCKSIFLCRDKFINDLLGDGLNPILQSVTDIYM